MRAQSSRLLPTRHPPTTRIYFDTSAPGGCFDSEFATCGSETTGLSQGGYTQRKVQMAMSNETPVVHIDPEILGGTPAFVGTRVPVKSLYDHLEAGDSLDEFLESFPSVTREQAVAALELARTMTEAHATAAR